MTQPASTPTPWHVISDRGRSVTLGLPTVVSIGTDPDNLDGFDIPIRNVNNGYDKARANAALIVQAVNSFDSNAARIRELESLAKRLSTTLQLFERVNTEAMGGPKSSLELLTEDDKALLEAKSLLNHTSL